ncbi:MAG: hypothetical protein Q3X94_10500, partial [Oscillospiraceae bacterium]|nr:hypothetical protein [Oscillospiraceae bacterium]
ISGLTGVYHSFCSVSGRFRTWNYFFEGISDFERKPRQIENGPCKTVGMVQGVQGPVWKNSQRVKAEICYSVNRPTAATFMKRILQNILT